MDARTKIFSWLQKQGKKSDVHSFKKVKVDIAWEYCQKISDSILLSGLSQLLERHATDLLEDHSNACGNYLISDEQGKYQYIGEAQNISRRLKQQSNPKYSTFYKNYLKRERSPTRQINIGKFNVRTIETRLGRKEIEEFGIVNIPTNLNRFQRGKRQRYRGTANLELWSSVQNRFAELLEQGEAELEARNTTTWYKAKMPFKAGLYWVAHSELGLIYIGESSNVGRRYNVHSGNTYFSALRRHVGEDILGFKLQAIKGKKRYFSRDEDRQVTRFLTDCTTKALTVNIGRFELEEYLIRKHRPILNRKSKQ